MKKAFFSFVMCIFALSMFGQQYVDLGLPSGTLWKTQNESGYYTFDEAVNRFGSSLPTWDQYVELYNNCRWYVTKRECTVIGPNGNYIVFPTAGYYPCWEGMPGEYIYEGVYWSSTPFGPEQAGHLWFRIEGDGMDRYEINYEIERCTSGSVRLVMN